MNAVAEEPTVEDRIECRVCGAKIHAVEQHLKQAHPELALADYEREHPGAPLLSDYAIKLIAEKKRVKAAPASATVTPIRKPSAFHEVFELGAVKEALNWKGGPIPVTVFERTGPFADMVPDIDPNYVYEPDRLKNCVMGFELNIPTFNFGHAGVGKTTLPEQIAARTNRPLLRAQHTIDMESRDITGQWTVKGGETVFQLGPLPLAMINGWVYLADEYDYGLAAVLAVYQPVLEGKSLVIKDAPPEYRVIKPHPNFRFVATGNTNGAGDETGLYQGTNVMNAANFERFGICIEHTYMAQEKESKILQGQAGIGKQHADKIVEFATLIREAFASNKLSHTISPRTLVYAAMLGLRRGSWRLGLQLAFTNRLSRVDREVAESLAQRIFE